MTGREAVYYVVAMALVAPAAVALALAWLERRGA